MLRGVATQSPCVLELSCIAKVLKHDTVAMVALIKSQQNTCVSQLSQAMKSRNWWNL